MACTIRDAAPADLDALFELERACFTVPWTREQLLHALPDERHELLLAVNKQGRLLGYVGMMTVLDEGYIANVAVDERCRRQGTGSALIEELLRRAEKRSLAFATLEVRESNEPARRLYAKHGFVPVGLRRGYYEAPRENAVLMTKFFE